MERKGDPCSELGKRSLLMPVHLATQIISCLRESLPEEGGGVLFGEVLATRFMSVHYTPILNIAHQTHVYQAEPRGLIDAVFQAQAKGLVPIATVHSHPTSLAVPSRLDMLEAFAYRKMLHLIVSFSTNPPDLCVYVYIKGHDVSGYAYREAPLILTNF